jgi:hypothetical protein
VDRSRQREQGASYGSNLSHNIRGCCSRPNQKYAGCDDYRAAGPGSPMPPMGDTAVRTPGLPVDPSSCLSSPDPRVTDRDRSVQSVKYWTDGCRTGQRLYDLGSRSRRRWRDRPTVVPLMWLRNAKRGSETYWKTTTPRRDIIHEGSGKSSVLCWLLE